MDWTDIGSKHFLKFCVEKSTKTYLPLLTKTINQCCDLFHVNMSLNELQVIESLFLGKGAKGHTFDVISQDDGRHLAMKVSIDCDLYQEYELFNAINLINPNLVISCPENSIVKFPLNDENTMFGYGYLINEIGTKVPLTSFTLMIEHLVKLHQIKYYHGDSRRENIIQIINTNNNTRELRWIDLRGSGNGSRFNRFSVAADLKYLMKSKYPKLTDIIWNQIFTEDILNEYFSNPNAAIINIRVRAAIEMGLKK